MKRRVFLAAAGSTAGALAGCLEAREDGESEFPPDDSTFAAMFSHPRHILSIEDIDPETARFVRDFAEVPDGAADALETAIETGEYVTDDPDAALLEGIPTLQTIREDGTNRLYVERDGTIYDIEHELPEYVISARDVPESAVSPDRTASRLGDERRNSDAVDDLVYIVHDHRAPGRGASDRAYRVPSREEKLDAFLEEYDYLVYPGAGGDEPEPDGYVELQVEYEDPGPPYAITAEEVPPERRYGRPVTDASAYPDEVATALRRIVRERPLSRPSLIRDELPNGIDAVLADDAAVRIDDDVYEPTLETVDHDTVPLSLELSAVDEAEHTFTLAAEADGEPVTLSSLTEHPTDPLVEVPDPMADDRESFEDGAVLMNRPDHQMWGSQLITTDLEAGETTATTYEVRSEDGLGGGTHRLVSGLAVERDDGAESATYPFVVTLSVPEPDV